MFAEIGMTAHASVVSTLISPAILLPASQIKSHESRHKRLLCASLRHWQHASKNHQALAAATLRAFY
jgi:hypothetical protein